MKFYFLISALSIFRLVCIGQNINIDSLELIQGQLSGQEKLESLGILTRHYSLRDSSKALIYGEEALSIALKINDANQIATAYMNLGTVKQENYDYVRSEMFFIWADSIYHLISSDKGHGAVKKALGNSHITQGNIKKGLSSFQAALTHFEIVKDTSAILGTYYNIGFSNYRLRNYDSAIYYYFKILPHCEISNSQTCLDMYNQLGTVYSEINEPKKALVYLMKSLSGSMAKNDSISAANTLMNIAGNYFYQQKMDSCAYYVNQSIDIYDQMGNLQGKAYGLNNLAIIYKETGQIEKSFNPTFKAIMVAKKIGDKSTLSGSYLNLVDLFFKIKQFKTAETYADSAFAIMKPLGSKYHLQQYYMIMAKLYKTQSKLSKAYDSRELYHVYKDSMVNETTSKQIAELETRYETEKKERQIIVLSSEKELQASIIKQNTLQLERNQAFILALAVTIGAITVLAIFLYNKQKYAQKIQIEEERNALKADQIKAVIQSQEEERKRFAMDLHDDFGQLISALRIHINQSISNSPGNNSADELLDNMYASLKNIAFNLMPHTLMEKGLSMATEELCDQLSGLSDLKFKVRVFNMNEISLSSAHKVAMYRVIQEVLNNIIKYSDAKKVDVSLTGLVDGFSIMIEDDGNGFDVNSLKNGLGNGWRNISSRIDLMNGAIDYDTMEGRKNSIVSIDIPSEHTEKIAA